MVINFAHLLEEHMYFEESFKAYEKGVAAFKWPHVKDLWLMYLSKYALPRVALGGLKEMSI